MWWPWSKPKHGRSVLADMARHRRTPIAEVPDGERRLIVGHVERAEDMLVAPLTGRRCFAWLVTIDEVGQGDSVQRGEAQQSIPFELRDATGRARIHAERARFGMGGMVAERPPGSLLDGAEGALFAQLKVTLNYPTSSVRFTERVVLPGIELGVVGYCHRESDPEAVDADLVGYRGDAPTLPVLSCTRRVPLLLG